MTIKNGKNLTQSIVDNLGLSIVKGEYDGLNFPTEAALVVKYSASRNIIREAVKILSEKGLLLSRPKRGTSIRLEKDWNILDTDILNWFLERKMSLPLLREFFQVRMQIEPAAAALAASVSGPDEIEKISKAMECMAAAEVGDSNALDADIAFHIALLEASGNRFYMKLSSLTETALRFSIRITNKHKNVDVHLKSHRDILDAIKMGDAEKAHEKTKALLLTVGNIIDVREKEEVNRLSGC
ncbi:MAG: FadR/GntR family transcriptional regulator [Robiginitomaculum sp.]